MLLIIGGSGQLGTELRAQFQASEYVAPSSKECDVTDYKSLSAYLDSRDDIALVINAAAFTDVAGAEREQEAARKLNTTAASNLARQCRQKNIPLIQISTDFVFDGRKQGSYSETDPTNPINIYGLTKKEAEDVIKDQLDRYIILRTSWLIGQHGKNFLKSILHVAREKEILEVVNDQTGGPTPTGYLARAIRVIADQIINHLETVDYGVYHFSGSPSCSWYDLASEIIGKAKELGKVPPSVKINPVTSAAYASSVSRPQNSQLDCSKIKQNFGIDQPDWKEPIEEIISALYPSV